MFNLVCPVCSTKSSNKFFYASGQFFCSESCHLQSKRNLQYTPLDIPFPICHVCEIPIYENFPEFFDEHFFCSTYCLDSYKDEKNIKSF